MLLNTFSNVLLILLGVSGSFFFISTILILKAFVFNPGDQYVYALRNITKKSKYKKKSTDKEIRKEEEKTRIKKNKEIHYNNLAHRMGLNHNYMKKQFYEANSVPILVFSIIIFIALEFIILKTNADISLKIISTIFIICATSLSIRIAFKPTLDVVLNKKNLDNDIVGELVLLIALYKNSESGNLYTILEDFSKNANALYNDIGILLSETGVYTHKEALERFGNRVNVPEVSRFVMQAKSLFDASKDARVSSLTIIEKEIIDSLNKRKELRDRNKQYVLLGTMITYFVAGAILLLSGTLGEILKMYSSM